MKDHLKRTAALLCAVAALLPLVSGCHADATNSAENQARTERRQAIVKAHKQQDQ